MAEEGRLYKILARVCEPAGEVEGRKLCRYLDGYSDAKVAQEVSERAKASHVAPRRAASCGELAPPPPAAPRADLFNSDERAELTKELDKFKARVAELERENANLRRDAGNAMAAHAQEMLADSARLFNGAGPAAKRLQPEAQA